MSRKKLIVLALAAMTLISFLKLFRDTVSTGDEYRALLTEGANYEELALYEKAIDCYEQAQKINETLDTYVRIGRIYMTTDDLTAAENTGKSALRKYSREPLAYEFLSDVYSERTDYKKLFALIEQMEAMGVHSEKVEAVKAEIYDKYRLSFLFLDGGSVFSNGLSPYMKDQRLGFVSTGGSTPVQSQYLKVGAFTGSYAPAYDGKNWFLIGTDGAKQENLTSKLGAVSDVGNMGAGVIPICIDGKYGYYSVDTLQLLSPLYDKALTFCEGCAAVKEANAWYIINTSYEKVSEALDDVRPDERGLICRQGRCFVKKSGSFYLTNGEGSLLSNTAYQDARCFGNEGYAAVKLNGKWGFIDLDGNMMISPEYQDARSFNNGYAAASDGSEWFFINAENKTVIQGDFTGAYDFSSDGTAFVQRSGTSWTLLYLYRFD